MTLLSIVLLSTLAFAGRRHAMEITDVQSCVAELSGIRDAAGTETAINATRRYLACLTDAEIIDRSVQDQVQAMVRKTGPVDSKVVVGHFFDLEQLKEMPSNQEQLGRAVILLEDQALARQVLGETDVSDAARQRARKMRNLENVLEGFGEG